MPKEYLLADGTNTVLYTTTEFQQLANLTYEGLRVWLNRSQFRPIKIWKTNHYTQEMVDELLQKRESVISENVQRNREKKEPTFAFERGEVASLFELGFDSLTPRQFDVLSLRYGLVDGVLRTRADIVAILPEVSDLSGIGMTEKRGVARLREAVDVEVLECVAQQEPLVQAVRTTKLTGMSARVGQVAILRYLMGKNIADVAASMNSSHLEVLELNRQLLLRVAEAKNV